MTVDCDLGPGGLKEPRKQPAAGARRGGAPKFFLREEGHFCYIFTAWLKTIVLAKLAVII